MMEREGAAQGDGHRVEADDRVDVDAAIRLVEANYAGWEDKRAALGEAAIREAARRAMDAADHVALTDPASRDTANAAIDEIIRKYLRTFQDRHLSLRTPAAGRGAPAAAGCAAHDGDFAARPLPPSGYYLRFPCFAFPHRDRINRLLAEHDAAIRFAGELVIDIRGNGGGSDQQWNGLLPYIYTHPLTEPGADFLATPENARLLEGFRRFIRPDETETLEALDRVAFAAAEAPGRMVSWVPPQRLELPEVLPRPARVIVFIDEGCASTAEQFLLIARECGKVRLVGRATRGCIDYSNPLEHPLPSGRRVIGIPCTRSRRLPHGPVDPTGIVAHVEVPAGAGEEAWFAAARRALGPDPLSS